jgi:hypothetical protein
MSDPFGKAGRAWLAERELVEEERETVDGGLRQIDLLDTEIAPLDAKVARLSSARATRSG